MKIINGHYRDLDSLRQQAQAGGNINTADLPSTSVRMALTVMGILPVMVIYPFMQKYFVKNFPEYLDRE